MDFLLPFFTMTCVFKVGKTFLITSVLLCFLQAPSMIMYSLFVDCFTAKSGDDINIKIIILDINFIKNPHKI